MKKIKKKKFFFDKNEKNEIVLIKMKKMKFFFDKN